MAGVQGLVVESLGRVVDVVRAGNSKVAAVSTSGSWMAFVET